MKNINFLGIFHYFNWKIIHLTIDTALQKRVMGLSSEIAYNSLLALFPALITILTALGLFQDSIQKTLFDLLNQYQDVFPNEVWELLENFILEVTQNSSKELFSLSIIVSIWISSNALGSTMNALDQIQQIPPQQRRPFWKSKLIAVLITISGLFLLILASFLVLLGDHLVRFAIFLIQRLPVDDTGGYLLLKIWRLLNWPLSFGIISTLGIFVYKLFHQKEDKLHPLYKIKTILIGLIISLISLIILIAFLIFINHLITRVSDDYSLSIVLVQIWQLLSWPVALAIVALAFAFIYRIGGSRWYPETPLLPGAILAAISWVIISGLFRLYVSNFGQYNKVYGTFGAIIVLMLWLQISALVMLIGYQLNIIIRELKKPD
jgi:membrane protein